MRATETEACQADELERALAGMRPFDLTFRDAGAVLSWLAIDPSYLQAPFFTEAVDAFSTDNPRADVVQTDLDALEHMARTMEPPSGFVFHTGRCGSTLVSNMLGASGALVIKEPPPLNQALLAARRGVLSRIEVGGIVDGLIRALGSKRSPKEPAYFLKLTSWNLLDLPMLLELFPETPRVYVYRDPIETLVSLVRSPPAWSAQLEYLLSERAKQDSAVVNFARLLGAQLETIAGHLGPGSLLLNYSEIGGDTPEKLAAFLGIDRRDDTMLAMSEQLQWYAKDSAKRHFAPDGAQKQASATEEMRLASRRWTGEAYARLEQARAHGA